VFVSAALSVTLTGSLGIVPTNAKFSHNLIISRSISLIALPAATSSATQVNSQPYVLVFAASIISVALVLEKTPAELESLGQALHHSARQPTCPIVLFSGRTRRVHKRTASPVVRFVIAATIALKVFAEWDGVWILFIPNMPILAAGATKANSFCKVLTLPISISTHVLSLKKCYQAV